VRCTGIAPNLTTSRLLPGSVLSFGTHATRRSADTLAYEYGRVAEPWRQMD
jgi:hypothetical protein